MQEGKTKRRERVQFFSQKDNYADLSGSGQKGKMAPASNFNFVHRDKAGRFSKTLY